MDPILVERLERTKDAAERWREVPIVVTGGVEKSGRTKGESMKEWLVDEGVDAARVHDENSARSTGENALYGVQFGGRFPLDPYGHHQLSQPCTARGDHLRPRRRRFTAD